jgi:hypothetical protein
MAPAPEISIEFPAAGDGNVTSGGRHRPAVTARYLTKEWAGAAAIVLAAAALWLLVIAILLAV